MADDLAELEPLPAEAGASKLGMMAQFDWTDPKMAPVYTKSANAKKFALQAAARAGAGADIFDPFDDQHEIADGLGNGQ